MITSIIVLAAILAIYGGVSLKNKRADDKRMKARMEQDRTVRGINTFTKVYLNSIANYLSANSRGSNCVEGIREILAQNGITPENLTRKDVLNLLNYIAKKYAPPKSYAPITEKHSRLLIDYVYDNLQISFQTGTAYKKFQKAVNKKMASVSKKDIEKYLREKYNGKFDDNMVSEIKKNLASGMAKTMSDNINTRMQTDMQNQMQLQMQNDMQNQMQLQMEMQMQNQMMMDMQNQMMMDMQNQMQNDMQNNLTMQMEQSQMDLSNTMHQGEMAITPMHDGGNMLDMNDMHMGGM